MQELLAKYGQYPEECELHFIGTLQTNKVKAIIDKVDMIESVDSLRLAREIDKCAAPLGKPMDILVEINIAPGAGKERRIPGKRRGAAGADCTAAVRPGARPDDHRTCEG